MKQVRASELPIYQDGSNKGSASASCNTIQAGRFELLDANLSWHAVQSCAYEPLPLEQSISKCRKEVGTYVGQYKEYGEKVTDVVKTGVEHTKDSCHDNSKEENSFEAAVREVRQFVSEGIHKVKAAVDYLKDEGNVLPRAGAIALGGLTGYILGIRRGRIRRYFNTAVGGLTVAAFLYPQEAKEVAGEAYDLSKKAAVVSYNFVVGAKPEGKCKTEVAEQARKCSMPKSSEEDSDLFGWFESEKKEDKKKCGCRSCRELSCRDDDCVTPHKRRRRNDDGNHFSVERRSASDTGSGKQLSISVATKEPSSDVTADCYRELKNERAPVDGSKQIIIHSNGSNKRHFTSDRGASDPGVTPEQHSDIIIVGKIITLDDEDDIPEDANKADVPKEMPYSGKTEACNDMEDWAYFRESKEKFLHYDKKSTDAYVWDPSEDVSTNAGFLHPLRRVSKVQDNEKKDDGNLCNTKEYKGSPLCTRNFPLQEASHDSVSNKPEAPKKDLSKPVPASKLVGDYGQSNPADKDLYTTRGSG